MMVLHPQICIYSVNNFLWKITNGVLGVNEFKGDHENFLAALHDFENQGEHSLVQPFLYLAISTIESWN